VTHAQTWASYSALYRFGTLSFFAHLRCKLDNINISGLEFGLGDLIVGSDEERALPKQWKLVFYKQLHFFAVDILRKMCDEDCRIKSAFQLVLLRIPKSCKRTDSDGFVKKSAYPDSVSDS